MASVKTATAPARGIGPLPRILNVEDAARLLGCSADALRKRCRKASVTGPDGKARALLAAGIVAFKFGASTWRVRIQEEKIDGLDEGSDAG